MGKVVDSIICPFFTHARCVHVPLISISKEKSQLLFEIQEITKRQKEEIKKDIGENIN